MESKAFEEFEQLQGETSASQTDFGEPIAPAGLPLSMALGLLGTLGLTGETGIGLYGLDTARFPGPCSLTAR